MTTNCQHRQVHNATWHCKECGELLPARHFRSSSMVTDQANNKAVVVGYEVIYECERCGKDLPVNESCGQTHRGDYLDEKGRSRTGEVVDISSEL